MVESSRARRWSLKVRLRGYGVREVMGIGFREMSGVRFFFWCKFMCPKYIVSFGVCIVEQCKLFSILKGV